MKNQVLNNNSLYPFVKVPLIVLFLISVLFSCSPTYNKQKIIPTRDLVDILTELYIADGLLVLPQVRAMYANKDSTTNYLDIIQRHGLTKERLDNTMRYYFEKEPKKFENIYDQVLTKLNEKQALLEKEKPPEVLLSPELWTARNSFLIPESGTMDSAWFSIAIKDTGNYILEFSTILYTDDQSTNPRVTVFFWHSDSTKSGSRNYWTEVNLPRDGQRHNYSLSKINSDTTVTHLNGWMLNSDPQKGRWVKHARIENITLRKAKIPVE